MTHLSILTLSTLFPNPAQPNHGVFVENRLRHLLASGLVDAEVVAPVPWMPRLAARHHPLGGLAEVPRLERRDGLTIHHPRYPVIPKVGMTLAPWLLARALRPVLARVLAARPIDLIDAHYFYPDGVAAVWLGQHFGLPVVVTARGTDLNLIPDYPVPRRLIVAAARRAAGLVAVCQALKDRLVELGIPTDRVRVLRNGVDLARFRPVDRAEARAALGLPPEPHLLVSVGQLIERKGHDLVIGALAELPGVHLAIAGNGPLRPALEAQAAALGVAGRVRFLGAVPHDRLRLVYGAADVSVLASSREGWANVLLESMACGTPVVASAVWGTPEVVAEPAAGMLMPERSAAGAAAAIRRLLDDPPPSAATRTYAEQFDWGATTDGQLQLFRSIVRRPAAMAAGYCRGRTVMDG